jgi:hypothetical protein
MRDPADRWEPWPVEVHITGGPSRIYDDTEAGEPTRFLGFRRTEPETEPLLWDGDQA